MSLWKISNCFIENNLWNLKNVFKKKLIFFVKKNSKFFEMNFFFKFSWFSRKKDRAQYLICDLARILMCWWEQKYQKNASNFFSTKSYGSILHERFSHIKYIDLKQICIFVKKKVIFCFGCISKVKVFEVYTFFF